jgi:uncharacterized membrane protein
MEQNNINVVYGLLQELRIPVSLNGVSEELEKHPEYGTLLAISETLDHWQVPNASYKLEYEELADAPVPFIAYCAKNEFLLVTKLDKQNLIVSNRRYNNHQLSAEEFKKKYRGVSLFAKKGKLSGEPDYYAKRRKEIADRIRLPFVISGALAIIFIFLFSNPYFPAILSLRIAFLAFFKTLGLVTSVLLLIQSVDADNPLIQKFCGSDDNKNCNAILTSNAAKITTGLSWSEVGFFYFAGTWLVLLFNSRNSGLMQLLALINLLSLPYTVYSIYYQWRLGKQWCIFCCAIQALLWLEFFAFTPCLFNAAQLPHLNQLGTLFAGLLAPVLLWVFIKPYLISAQQLPMFKKELFQFKYNKELFKKMLNSENKYALLPEEDTIIIGNREANNVITLVYSVWTKRFKYLIMSVQLS